MFNNLALILTTFGLNYIYFSKSYNPTIGNRNADLKLTQLTLLLVSFYPPKLGSPHVIKTSKSWVANSVSTEVSFAKSFVQFFRDHPAKFAKDPSSTSMTIGGKKFAYDDIGSVEKLFTATLILKYDLADWWRLPHEEKLTHFTNFIEGTFRQDALKVREIKASQKSLLKQNGKANLELPDVEYILAHLQPCRLVGDVRKDAGWRFIDTKTNMMTDYDYYSVTFALQSSGLDKDMITEFMAQMIHIKEAYDPKDPERLKKIPDTNNIYQINRYVLPEWRTIPDVEPELPEEVDFFMRHLFPNETCRNFVYTWIYHSLTTRAGTYLYLCSWPGTGKNTLAKIITALQGMPNTSLVKGDALKNNFNYYLKYKKFIFMDEFSCRGRQDRDKLKLIINDRIQIEGKGKDHEDIEVFASYLLANNSLEAIGLEPDDRRFSVPETTHDQIVKKVGRPWMGVFEEKILDPSYIARLGHWILENFQNPKWGAEEPYLTSRFEEIVLATARIGIIEMVAKVLNREQAEYSYLDEKDSFRRVYKNAGTYPSLADWTKFWRDVKRHGQPLGTVEGTKFTPAEDYAPVRGGGDL